MKNKRGDKRKERPGRRKKEEGKRNNGGWRIRREGKTEGVKEGGKETMPADVLLHAAISFSPLSQQVSLLVTLL